MDTIKQTYVFRPRAPDVRSWLRYADDQWIKDDGKPDMAFMATSWGMCQSIKLPYYAGIKWAWRATWDGYDFDFDNPWHYQVADPLKGCGEVWDRDKHPNILAGRAAMDKCASIWSYANGSGPEVYQDSDWIKTGTLWVAETMQPVLAPLDPTCFLCMDGMRGHMEHRRQRKLDSYRLDLKRLEDEEVRLSGIVARKMSLREMIAELGG